MGEESEQSFFRRHWEGYKEFWGERFSFLENYSRFIKRDKPLPSWSSTDVDQFIASDPLKTTREAVNFAVTGSVIGAASTAGVAWKYSRSPHGQFGFDQSIPTAGHDFYHVSWICGLPEKVEDRLNDLALIRGAAMSLVAGAAFGFTFGHEVANHWYQLYRLDTMAAQVKFMEWWERKSEGQS
ncbi:hypothetical protein JRO89_XS10G0212400 [Xanthoceras sorbifolium]|uniref:Uncharacterized protein n=1 Tax=Xanthoceras sorbifolium TaxID=99658 RepID=A0ABQ8HJY9_9ROSI|nr:hypothetical protein JRO89_XS10G0212400 [Xanthoceras sorbifolium]